MPEKQSSMMNSRAERLPDALKVTLLEKTTDAVYAAFLDRLSGKNPAVLGYHYPFYRDMLVSAGIGEPLYYGAWAGPELVGVLPGFIKKSPAGLAYCSLPFFGPNAGVLCAGGDAESEIHRELLTTVLRYLQ